MRASPYGILDKIAEIDVPEESLERKLVMGATGTFDALMIFQQSDLLFH